MPQNAEGRPLDRASERARDIRPYFVHIKAENLIGSRFEKNGGRNTLTQIRIRETITESDGPFGEREDSLAGCRARKG